MAKLQDMFLQARRAQSGGGMGFLGKNRGEFKPRAAALVIELTNITPGSAEAVLKAGADGLLFTWNGKDSAFLEALKTEIDSVKGTNENLVTGLHITGDWNSLDRDSFSRIHDQGIQYVLLPITAPARLLMLEAKDIEMAVIVPMREGEMYPSFIRNLTAFEGIAAVLLDFNLTTHTADMSIEDVLRYRAVREAVRFPALINVQGNMSEAEAYTLLTLGVQAVVYTANDVEEATRQQIKELHALLAKVHHEDKDTPTTPFRTKSKVEYPTA